MYKKIKHRLVLIYLRQKFKLLEKVDIKSAAEELFALLCTPYNSVRNYSLSPIFQKATPLTHIFEQVTTKGYYWEAENENTHKILICHGFDSASYKFERYIEPLLQLGFGVVAFDAPAHGLSAGTTINVLQYRNYILELIEKFGPFDGILAHSFGAIATALAAEQLPANSIRQMVLIAPATETTRSIADFCRIIGISPMLQNELESLITQTGGKPISWYSAARAIQSISIKTLWIHDKNDPITPYHDMAYLQDLNLSYTSFHITDGLGHSPYSNADIAKLIVEYIGEMTGDEV